MSSSCVQAVTYQLGTMMAGIQQTLRYADDEIREYNIAAEALRAHGRRAGIDPSAA